MWRLGFKIDLFVNASPRSVACPTLPRGSPYLLSLVAPCAPLSEVGKSVLTKGSPVMADVRGRCQRSVALSLLLAVASVSAAAQSNVAVRALAQREKQPLLDT